MLDRFPSFAVNGYLDGKCSQTNYEENPWWRVDLQDEYFIMAVVVSNCCKNDMKHTDIRVGNNENMELNKICGTIDILKDDENRIILCPSDLAGRYVYLSSQAKNKSLSICEIKVHQVLGNSVLITVGHIVNYKYIYDLFLHCSSIFIFLNAVYNG